MPIQKFSVEHKFGIISHGYRQELEKVFRKQSETEIVGKSLQRLKRNDDLLESISEFVSSYNSLQTKCRETLFKTLFERVACSVIQRTLSSRKIFNTSLTYNWYAALSLSHVADACKQLSCLRLLFASLRQTVPTDETSLHSLISLANVLFIDYVIPLVSTSLTSISSQDIKCQILQIGKLLMFRLFYLHMTGSLSESPSALMELKTHIEDMTLIMDSPMVVELPVCTRLAFSYIIEIGRIITSNINATETPSAKDDNETQLNLNDLNIRSNKHKHVLHAPHNTPVKLASKGSLADLSPQMHDLSPSLWHSLDIFRCTKNLSQEECLIGSSVDSNLFDVLASAKRCMFTEAETWIDASLAMHFLCGPMSRNLSTLQWLTTLAVQRFPQWSWQLQAVYAEVIAECLMYGDTAELRRFALLGNRAAITSADVRQRWSLSLRNESTHMCLIDLYLLRPEKSQSEDDIWRIRGLGAFWLQSAYLELKCQNDLLQRPMLTALIECVANISSHEKDLRVIAAFKDAKDSPNSLYPKMPVSLRRQRIFDYMAGNLSALYLPC